MKKIRFGIPEEHVPSKYCKGFSYRESEIAFDLTKIKFTETPGGCRLEFPLAFNEAIYGFGLQLQGFNHKGYHLELRVNSDPLAYTGDSHAPVPFFASTAGYGMYLDTARFIDVCCGYIRKKNRHIEENNIIKTDTDELYRKTESKEESVMVIDIPSAKGIDLYIMEDETITGIVSQYNMLAGGGCTCKEEDLGMLYRCNAKYSEEEVLKVAEYLREHRIPCDTLGLEPGWQSHAYSCSYVWNRDLYPNYRETLQKLRQMGYGVNLWEHAFVHPSSPLYEPLMERSCDFEVWNGLVPDFSEEETQEIFADYHRKNMVEAGVTGFKLDECDGSDYRGDWTFPNCSVFPSGMDGEQYHSLFGVLYMQTMMKALEGKEHLSEVRNAGALSAGYPFVLYSDLYDLKDFIRGTVNAGFSGILWTPEVRDATSREDFLRRLQCNVFSVQCLINAWYCDTFPWFEFDCEDEVRELLEVREGLKPELKRAFDLYRETGKPPVRALVSDFTKDPNTYEIDDEYIFCENYIVAPILTGQTEREVYLPEGEYEDFWTGEKRRGGRFCVQTERIPVYRRIGD